MWGCRRVVGSLRGKQGGQILHLDPLSSKQNKRTIVSQWEDDKNLPKVIWLYDKKANRDSDKKVDQTEDNLIRRARGRPNKTLTTKKYSL